ncbi:MAG: hypothetical protein IT210_20805 [Armatimonadetes bacterium]|nr:hypothetical protein [Armatimonadota bacterium]
MRGHEEKILVSLLLLTPVMLALSAASLYRMLNDPLAFSLPPVNMPKPNAYNGYKTARPMLAANGGTPLS